MSSIPTDTIERPEQLPVLILAGGQGNGLFPLTIARPKPSLAFGPCRIVDFTLLNCRNSGLKDCVLLTQYRRDQIAADKVGISKNWDICMAESTIDVLKQKMQNLKADLVAAGVLTQARADEIFS